VYENINLCLLKCNVFLPSPSSATTVLFVENYIFILMLQHIFGWYQKEQEEKHNNIENEREIGENVKICCVQHQERYLEEGRASMKRASGFKSIILVFFE
jgi:hypothetical protein